MIRRLKIRFLIWVLVPIVKRAAPGYRAHVVGSIDRKLQTVDADSCCEKHAREWEAQLEGLRARLLEIRYS